MPRGWDGFGCGLLVAFNMPPRYLDGGRGDVADETDDESKDLVDGLGDRGYVLCDGSAMAHKKIKGPCSQPVRKNAETTVWLN